MWSLRKIRYVGRVKPESNMEFHIHPRTSCPRQGHWSCYTWIYSKPVAYISIGGNKYGFVIVDNYSRFTWVFFLQDKSEVQETFKKFARRAQNEFEVKIKRIRSDNGSEFKNTSIEEFLDEEGIKHEFSAPYTPQQNGVVERKNRTLIEAARTMLDEYKTSDQFWTEAVNTACHAVNRLYLHKILKKTAYELLTGNKPKVHYFRVFGSNALFSIRNQKVP